MYMYKGETQKEKVIMCRCRYSCGHAILVQEEVVLYIYECVDRDRERDRQRETESVCEYSFVNDRREY